MVNHHNFITRWNFMNKQLSLLLLLSGLGVSGISAESASEQLKNIAQQTKEAVEEKAEQLQEVAQGILGTTEAEKEEAEEKKDEAAEKDFDEFEKLKAFFIKRTKDCWLVKKFKQEPYSAGFLIGSSPFILRSRSVQGAVALGVLVGLGIDYYFDENETSEQ